jgi:hypothetical protein
MLKNETVSHILPIAIVLKKWDSFSQFAKSYYAKKLRHFLSLPKVGMLKIWDSFLNFAYGYCAEKLYSFKQDLKLLLQYKCTKKFNSSSHFSESYFARKLWQFLTFCQKIVSVYKKNETATHNFQKLITCSKT